MRAPALLADSASDTGVHYCWPNDVDDDDDDEFWPMPFVFDIDDDCVSQLADSALDTGVHCGWPEDDDDQIRPLNFLFDINDGNAIQFKGIGLEKECQQKPK